MYVIPFHLSGIFCERRIALQSAPVTFKSAVVSFPTGEECNLRPPFETEHARYML